MRQWLEGLLYCVSAESDGAQAIGYILARCKALTRFADDGPLKIDNNAAERALRGVSLGRKNYLFMGSDAGAQRAAAFYRLVQTSKLTLSINCPSLKTHFGSTAPRVKPTFVQDAQGRCVPSKDNASNSTSGRFCRMRFGIAAATSGPIPWPPRRGPSQ